MKKVLIILILITTLSIIGDLNNTKIIIPEESIRLRVIANSNKEEDQNLKLKVKNNLQEEINNVLNNKRTITESRNALKNNLSLFEKNINDTLIKENSNQKFTINYGQNYFPEKEYKKVKYHEGNYESLVVTLGDGLGENFWCVLFPPLCLLDAEESNSSKVEYHVLVKDILSKYKKVKQQNNENKETK